MKFIDGYVRSPFAGIAPWVLMGVVSGPGRFEEAASAALGLALLTLWVGSRRGVPVHLLEVFTVVYFGVLAVFGLVASDSTIDWLALWAGELSNIALAAFAIVTLLIRKPFTLAYAKDTTPREHWDDPLFLRINYMICAGSFTEFYPDHATGESTSWARIFDWLPPFVLVTGIVGWVSDAVPDGVGIGLIVVGIVGSAAMRRLFPSEAEATEPQ